MFELILRILKVNIFLSVGLGLLPILLSQMGKVQAQTVNLPIQATVKPNCVILNSQGINFGLYDPLGIHKSTDLTAKGSVTVQCLGEMNISAKISEGMWAEASSSCSAPLRQMVTSVGKTGPALPYRLSHQPQVNADIWGCDANNSYNYKTINSRSVEIPIYGRILSGQSLPSERILRLTPGNYSDTVNFFISF